MWNIIATQNDDINWLRCLLLNLSEELGDGNQKDQHEMLTLLLEKLRKVIFNYFHIFRIILHLKFRRKYYHRISFTAPEPQPSSVHHAIMRLQTMCHQNLSSLPESLLMRKSKKWEILSTEPFLVQMQTVQPVKRGGRLFLCTVATIPYTWSIQISFLSQLEGDQ